MKIEYSERMRAYMEHEGLLDVLIAKVPSKG